MMMLGDKKKMAATIVAKMKDSSKKPDFVQKMGEKGYEAKEVDSSKPESDHEAGLHAAAADLISAVHAKDEKRVNKALQAHYELSKYDVPNSDEESAGSEANKESIDD